MNKEQKIKELKKKIKEFFTPEALEKLKEALKKQEKKPKGDK